MKLKHGINILGLVFLLTGSSIIGGILYSNVRMANEREKAIESNTIKVSEEVEPTATPTEELSIEVLSSDMKVRKVKSYKNVITIPSVGIVAPINEGVSSSAMATGVGHFKDTPKIGEVGNTCYAGHYSDIYNCIFNKLPKADMYSKIEAYDSRGKKHIYYIVSKYVTEPSNVGVLKNVKNKKKITIVTCSDGGTKRLIVEGLKLTRSELQSYKDRLLESKYAYIVEASDSIGDVKVCDYIDFRGRLLNIVYNVSFSNKPCKHIIPSLNLGGRNYDLQKF